MWYVIQTQTGKELKVKQKIEMRLSPEVYEDCRIIYYETKRKYEGKWHLEKKTMFPGYLFIVTDKIEDVFLQLKKVPELTKLLGYGEEIVPITPKEEAFLSRISNEEHTVEMSYGIQDGDKIIVKEGVLKGLESIIRKIDRHKRKAFIEVEILGEKRQVEIGLEIVSKK
ncbi:MAG: antiterminator LoaP [Parasporobacterium sp.]|nr:antiterminator LoaP [Parasporobacterium sp.]